VNISSIPWFWVFATILAMHYFLGAFVARILP
jgi:hypothetical protein